MLNATGNLSSKFEDYRYKVCDVHPVVDWIANIESVISEQLISLELQISSF